MELVLLPVIHFVAAGDLHNRKYVAGSNNRNRPVAQGDSSQEKVQLKRELGLFSAVSLIVGVMIGDA
jgi:hypothetical protein